MLDLRKIGNMLDQGSAERDIEQLDATANAEHRHIALVGAPGESELEGVASLVDAIGLRVNGVIAEEGGIDIGAAAEDEAIHKREDILFSSGDWGKNDRRAAGSDNGI